MQDYRTLYLSDMSCGYARNYRLKPRSRFTLRRMDSRSLSVSMTLTWSPRLPGWTRPRTHDMSESDAAFAAGIALKLLDDLMRADPPWPGCWRDRLALKSASVAAKMLGCNEDEHALRDAILLTTTGDDPGPAGKLFVAT